MSKPENRKICPYCDDKVQILDREDSCLGCWGKGHYTILYYFIPFFIILLVMLEKNACLNYNKSKRR
jgi:hypothetical protein